MQGGFVLDAIKTCPGAMRIGIEGRLCLDPRTFIEVQLHAAGTIGVGGQLHRPALLVGTVVPARCAAHGHACDWLTAGKSDHRSGDESFCSAVHLLAGADIRSDKKNEANAGE